MFSNIAEALNAHLLQNRLRPYMNRITTPYFASVSIFLWESRANSACYLPWIGTAIANAKAQRFNRPIGIVNDRASCL